ncbi:F-box protein CPR1-like [Cornus florida]|uniref:F-box protein CPR1-like n=1 Tax=Cornus florida TaxID=4283 RepID=UPI00289DB8C5|nr:F-box protein CPR1-like [Cornus florida]
MNGALHWFGCEESSEVVDIVVAFDPLNEKHQLPQVPDLNFTSETLGVLCGCLCIFYNKNLKDSVELWVMNDYMVESSWTKLFRVKLPSVKYSEDHSLKRARVLAYSKTSREVVLLHLFGTLIWYDLKENRVVDLGIGSVAAIVNVKSLVKLNYYQ